MEAKKINQWITPKIEVIENCFNLFKQNSEGEFVYQVNSKWNLMIKSDKLFGGIIYAVRIGHDIMKGDCLKTQDGATMEDAAKSVIKLWNEFYSTK